jgi:hypothetical protein
MNLHSKVIPVVKKVNMYEPKFDRLYWQTQSYQSRLAAVEQIRQEYHQWKYNAEPRLQRVYQITKR